MTKAVQDYRLLYILPLIIVMMMLTNIWSVEASEKDYQDEMIKPFLPMETMDDTEQFVDLTDEDIILEGLKDQWEYYYQMPTTDNSKGNELVLTVEYSDLIKDYSNLSVYIDGDPVKSSYLNQKDRQLTIKVPLKKKYTTSGTHRINIVYNGYLSEKICSYEGTSASWLVITPSSYMSLGHQSVLDQKDVFANYPYPFIDQQSDEQVNSKIVVPEDPSYKTMLSAIQIAQFLNGQSLKSEIKIIQADQLDKISEHLIFVGEKDAWGDKIKQVISDNVTIEKDKMALQNLFVHQDANDYQMLFVTADQDETIYDHVQVLTQNKLSKQLSGTALSVDKPSVNLADKTAQNSVSIGDMDVASLTIHESRTKSQNILMYHAQNITQDSDITMNLNYKISRTLLTHIENQESDAELVVHINGVPHSIAIKDIEDLRADQFIETKINIEPSTLIGQRNADVQFEVKGIVDDDDCTAPQEDQWIYIDNATNMTVNSTDTNYNQSFKNWPNLVDNRPLSVIMPKEKDEDAIDQLYLLISSIDSPQMFQNLNIMSADKLDEEKLSQGNGVLLGQAQADWLDGSLDISVDEKGNLDLSAYEFINETIASASWVQTSPWNKAYDLIVFTSQNDGKFIDEKLLNYMTALELDRDIVVESKNGKIFSQLMADASLNADEHGEQDQKEINAFDNLNWFVIGIAALIILSLVILIVRYRKTK